MPTQQNSTTPDVSTTEEPSSYEQAIANIRDLALSYIANRDAWLEMGRADLAAKIATAQAAGDLAYSLLAHADYSAEDLSDAYHYEYTATMRRLGTPMPCSCDHCRIWKELL
jgi:hypothetical protein